MQTVSPVGTISVASQAVNLKPLSEAKIGDSDRDPLIYKELILQASKQSQRQGNLIYRSLQEFKELRHFHTECQSFDRVELVRQIRQWPYSFRKDSQPINRARFFAVLSEYVSRSFGFTPTAAQQIALLTLSDPEQKQTAKGVCAQVDTGEGKSLILMMLAVYYTSICKPVCIITSDPELANRDCQQAREFLFNLLGMRPLLLGAAISVAGACNLVYATPSDICFELLRGGIAGCMFPDMILNRIALIDESDDLFMEKQNQLCRISVGKGHVIKEQALKALATIGSSSSAQLSKPEILRLLTDLRAHQSLNYLSDAELCMWVLSAQQVAQDRVVAGRDYCVQNNKIVVLDYGNTGRCTATSWMYGMTQMLQLKHGLRISPVQDCAAEIGYSEVVKLFSSAVCVTGSSGSLTDRLELQRQYGLECIDIPAQKPRQALDDRPLVLPTFASTLQVIIEDVKRKIQSKRPVLVAACSLSAALEIGQAFSKAGIKFQLLTDVYNWNTESQDCPEQELINNAGKAGVVTIATTAGRGTHIPLGIEAARAGGLHVIISFITPNLRLERQLRGRSARRGEPGSSAVYASVDLDPTLTCFKPALRHALLGIVKHTAQDSRVVEYVLEFIRFAHNIERSLEREQLLQRGTKYAALQSEYFELIKDLVDECLNKVIYRIPASQREQSNYKRIIANIRQFLRKKVSDELVGTWQRHSGKIIALIYNPQLKGLLSDVEVAPLELSQHSSNALMLQYSLLCTRVRSYLERQNIQHKNTEHHSFEALESLLQTILSEMKAYILECEAQQESNLSVEFAELKEDLQLAQKGIREWFTTLEFSDNRLKPLGDNKAAFAVLG